MYKRTLTSIVAALLLILGIPAQSEPASCPALLDHHFKVLHKNKQIHLCEDYANTVILVVNTASQCGFTPQFKGLEKLYQTYKDQGFVVLGFPSNDFLQDRDDDQQIEKFCRINYGVTFPMFSKSAVRGSDANPLYQALAEQQGQAPWWNFYKYLINRDGEIVALYNSRVEPQDPLLIQNIEKLL